ncbi:hypothetical protein BS78_05G072500 [Paspalum vaginatum]|nr:hypothetical protein BS78_05G072500 [Paspalum vaginatum]KAJ1274579.1 hypothetical protein BS78_05G072500 [Paspalum vaginatum]
MDFFVPTAWITRGVRRQRNYRPSDLASYIQVGTRIIILAAPGNDGCSDAVGRRWSLRGITALVTGGTHGIGRAVVEELAALGATVHTCARNEAELRSRLAEWDARHGSGAVTGSTCDVSVREQRERLVADAAARFGGRLSVLVNNVGTNVGRPTTEYTADEYAFVMATNLESAYHLCQLAHPMLKASGKGSVVLVSSVAGIVAVDFGSIYAMTKGAMNQLAKNLACEWAKDGIRVNSVAPWYIKTPLVQGVLSRAEYVQSILRRSGAWASRRRSRRWWRSSACPAPPTSPARPSPSTAA